jgi:hypothetical protein
MRVLIHGTKTFNQYEIFINALGRVIRSMEDGDDELIVATLGPTNITHMAHEFINISERTLKANGVKPKVLPRTIRWAKSNLDEFDELIFFCKPKERLSEIAALVDKKSTPDLVVYRY